MIHIDIQIKGFKLLSECLILEFLFALGEESKDYSWECNDISGKEACQYAIQ
jgi:hypothetical protein